MIPVTNSSSVAGYEYDSATQQLTLEFVKTQGTYTYYEVPEVVFRELAAAESKGKYFYAYIRGRYRFDKHETSPTENVA